jgi:2,4-dienoyl-CoA reductase-like NADH-dependent reductase (Old Yellow Enzyme family)
VWTPPQRIRHAVAEASWPAREAAARSRLFSPVEVGAIRLATRTWVPAMVPWRATEDGEATPDVIAWYERFARGRPGAIVVEATGIRDVPSGPLLRIGHDRFIPGLRRIVDAVRRASEGETRLFIQCIDFLAIKRRPTPEAFFGRFWNPTPAHRTRLARAMDDERWRTADDARCRAALLAGDAVLRAAILDARELRDLEFGWREEVCDTDRPHIADLPRVLPDLFADAAVRARAAGFDGVELHYAHAYTMASFLSPTNTRRDGYGGDLTGRLRLPLEVFARVRERVGADFVVGCRFLGDEVIAGGHGVEDAAAIGCAFARAGMDFLSISRGGKFDDARQPRVGEAVYPYTGPSGYECMPTVYSDARGPFGRNVPVAAAIRAAVRAIGLPTPVVTAGGIATFELAEAILVRGEADIVAAARQSLADPDWFLKVRLGHGDQVRRCMFTNYCEALDTKHKQVTCQLWDRVDLHELGVPRSTDGKRRLVAPAWTPADAP